MTLLSKLHKNSILTGPVESYCLVCSCALQSEEACYAHIHDEEHLFKLEAVPKLDNFRDDGIIKNKEGYYCPHCNIILPTIKRVTLHITNQTHIYNKISQSITRQDGHILYGSVNITERSWNGMDGATCFVCNEDYSDEEGHKTAAKHVLKLIQSRCDFGGTFIYRKVDDDSFFCLICGNFYSNEYKPNHHECEIHLEFYNSSMKLGAELLNKTNNYVEPNNNVIPSKAVQIQDSSGSKHIENTDYQVYGSEVSTTDDKKKADPSNAGKLNGNAQLFIEKSSVNKVANGAAFSFFKFSEESFNATKSDEAKPVNAVKTDEVKNAAKSDKAKPVDAVKTDEVKNAAKSDVTDTVGTVETGEVTNATKSDVAKPVNAVKIDANKTATTSNTVNAANKNKKEHPVYKFLQDNYFIATTEKEDFCTLCDIFITPSVELHEKNEHHMILNSKLMARKAARNIAEESKVNEANDKKQNQINDSPSKNENTPEKNSQAKKTNASNSKTKAYVTEKENKSIEIPNKTKDLNAKKPLNNKVRSINQAETLEKAIISEEQTNNQEPDIENNKTEVGKENVPISNNGQQTQANVQTKKASKRAKKKLKRATKIAKENYEQTEVTVPIKETEHNDESIDAKQETATITVDSNNEDNEDSNSRQYSDVTLNPLSIVLETVSQFDNSSEDLVVNKSYVLGNMSFMLIVQDGVNYTCIACDVEMVYDDVHKHITVEEHRSNVESSQVVITLKDEFIRQVNPLKYHCGYCNIATLTWPDMLLHLASFRHDDAKTSAAWRLERYLPHLQHCTTREVRNILCSVTRATRE